jgi:hypothetical protein
VNVYLRLRLTCHLLSPSAAAGFIADLRNELYTHQTPQALFIWVLLDECPFCFLQYTALLACCNCSPFLFGVCMGMCTPPLSGAVCHAFPFSKHTGGGGATPTFSSWLVYLEFAWESAPPPLRWSFPHDNHCFKVSLLQGFWAGAANSCLLWPACLFTVRVRECHSPELREPCPLCYISFFFQLLVYY